MAAAVFVKKLVQPYLTAGTVTLKQGKVDSKHSESLLGGKLNVRIIIFVLLISENRTYL